MKFIKNPHDKYFRSAMSNKKVAIDFFNHFLPQEFLSSIDLQTVKIEKESYVDKNLKELVSDILYSVQINDEKGYLYLLVVHQRQADSMMPFRLLEYTCKIMRREVDNGKKNLPVVIPLVLYNGDVQYPYDKDIFSLFGDEQQITLAKKCLCTPFNLIDLSDIPDTELMGDNWANIMAMLMKHITSRDLINVIESMLDKLRFLYEGESEEYFWSSVNYIMAASDIDDYNDLADILGEINTKVGDKVMSTLERIFAKGRDEGISQGISQGMSQGMSQGVNQGRKEGYLQGIRSVAKKMLTEGADQKLVFRVTGLSIEEIELLRNELTEKSSE